MTCFYELNFDPNTSVFNKATGNLAGQQFSDDYISGRATKEGVLLIHHRGFRETRNRPGFRLAARAAKRLRTIVFEFRRHDLI